MNIIANKETIESNENRAGVKSKDQTSTIIQYCILTIHIIFESITIGKQSKKIIFIEFYHREPLVENVL